MIVSNHGGRQLDGAIAAVRALPAIAEAVAGKAEIMLDGGVRRGPDILKALALGASACMIGRSYVWGLASAGEAGVAQALDLLAAELDNAMALLGLGTLSEIGCRHLKSVCGLTVDLLRQTTRTP